jgi:hypothetical protein
VPSTIDGRTIVVRLRPRSSQGGTYPDAGSQPSRTEKSRISMMPSQKCGTDRPESARALAARSSGVPRRTAETTPVGMPSTSATSIEASASSIVTGSLEASSSVTGILLRSDSPRSPRRTLLSQIPYWTTSGRSRW